MSALLSFGKTFWRAIFSVVYPFLLVPILLQDQQSLQNRVLYIILLVVGYVLTECIPVGATGFIPALCLPLMAVLDGDVACMSYYSPVNMKIVGLTIISTSLETSLIARRLALNVFLPLSSQPFFTYYSFLQFLLPFSTTLILSFLFSDLYAFFLVLPIVREYLKELETQGLDKNFEEEKDLSKMDEEERLRGSARPSSITKWSMLGLAYVAKCGGCVGLRSSSSNVNFRDIYNGFFPDAKVTSRNFFFYNILPTLISAVLIFFYLRLVYISFGKSENEILEKSKNARTEIKNNIKEKSSPTLPKKGFGYYALCMILVLFLIATFTSNYFGDLGSGWFSLFEKEKWIDDLSIIMLFTVILFMVPLEFVFFRVFSDQKEKRPQKPSNTLVLWKIVHERIPWDIVMLIGGGYCIQKGLFCSKIVDIIRDKFVYYIKTYDPAKARLCICILCSLITEVIDNTAAVQILTPIVIEATLLVSGGKRRKRFATAKTGRKLTESSKGIEMGSRRRRNTFIGKGLTGSAIANAILNATLITGDGSGTNLIGITFGNLTGNGSNGPTTIINGSEEWIVGLSYPTNTELFLSTEANFIRSDKQFIETENELIQFGSEIAGTRATRSDTGNVTGSRMGRGKKTSGSPAIAIRRLGRRAIRSESLTQIQTGIGTESDANRTGIAQNINADIQTRFARDTRIKRAGAGTGKPRPLAFVLPALGACSNAFLLPIASPLLGTVYAWSNIRMRSMFFVGLGAKIIHFVVFYATWDLIGETIFGSEILPGETLGSRLLPNVTADASVIKINCS